MSRCVPRVSGRRRRDVEANSDISVDFNVALDTSIPLPGESTVSSVDDLLDAASQATGNVAAQTITVNGEAATSTNVKTPAIVTGRFANQSGKLVKTTPVHK